MPRRTKLTCSGPSLTASRLVFAATVTLFAAACSQGASRTHGGSGGTSGARSSGGGGMSGSATGGSSTGGVTANGGDSGGNSDPAGASGSSGVSGKGGLGGGAAGSSGVGGSSGGGPAGSSGVGGSSGSGGAAGNGGAGGGAAGSGGVGGSSGGGSIGAITLDTGIPHLDGMTSDGMVIYQIYLGARASLKATSVEGGEPITIAETDGGFADVISGGAVAFWTGNTINIWTKATGLKTVTGTKSSYPLFVATDDGTDVVFVDGVTSDVDNGTVHLNPGHFVRTTAANPSATPITNAADINMAATSVSYRCPPSLSFVGHVLYAAYCTGTDENKTSGQLYVVPSGSLAATRLDPPPPASPASADGIYPWTLTVTSAGDRVFFIAPDNTSAAGAGTGKIVTVASGSVVPLEPNATRGAILPAGTGTFWETTAGALMKANASGGSKAPLLAGGPAIDGLVFGVSSDLTHLTYNASPKRPDLTLGDLVDLRVVDTTAPNQTAVDLVTTSTAKPPVSPVRRQPFYALLERSTVKLGGVLGFSGTGTYAIYQDNCDKTTRTCAVKARRSDGSEPEKTLASGGVNFASPDGFTGVLLAVNPHTDSLVDLKWVNPAQASPTPVDIATNVYDEVIFFGGRVVYWNPAGVFSGALPSE